MSTEDELDAFNACASDLYMAACQLEPLELGVGFEDAADALENGDADGANAALNGAADGLAAYALLLEDEDDSEGGAGTMLREAAGSVRAAGEALSAAGD